MSYLDTTAPAGKKHTYTVIEPQQRGEYASKQSAGVTVE